MKDRIRDRDGRPEPPDYSDVAVQDLPDGAFGPDPDEALNWIQGWYFAHCDGEWENADRIRIESVDNPGWLVRIRLQGTELAERPFEPISREWSVGDWFYAEVKHGEFTSTCSPLNLSWSLTEFRHWAGAQVEQAEQAIPEGQPPGSDDISDEDESRDEGVRPDPDEALIWIQGWYMSHCDGDWEHAYGATFETRKDRGWVVRIELQDTELASRPFEPIPRGGDVDDWFDIGAASGVFTATCSSLNLSWCLTEFRHWAQKRS